nr:MAG TPA: hypothetical protein [Caudoviricetes sp.]
MCVQINALNCWDVVKLICQSVWMKYAKTYGAKAEKRYEMAHGQILNAKF